MYRVMYIFVVPPLLGGKMGTITSLIEKDKSESGVTGYSLITLTHSTPPKRRFPAVSDEENYVI